MEKLTRREALISGGTVLAVSGGARTVAASSRSTDPNLVVLVELFHRLDQQLHNATEATALATAEARRRSPALTNLNSRWLYRGKDQTSRMTSYGIEIIRELKTKAARWPAGDRRHEFLRMTISAHYQYEAERAAIWSGLRIPELLEQEAIIDLELRKILGKIAAFRSRSAADAFLKLRFADDFDDWRARTNDEQWDSAPARLLGSTMADMELLAAV